MDTQRVDLFITANMSNFPTENIGVIRERLLAIDDSKFGLLASLKWKSPTTALVLTVVFGLAGIDRFYIGDVGKGVAKILALFVGVGVLWWIVDWFRIKGKTRNRNY